MTAPRFIQLSTPRFITDKHTFFGGDCKVNIPMRADFDGDWDTQNNASNYQAMIEANPSLFTTPKNSKNQAAIYFQQKESDTHVFVTYYLYYPQDGGPGCFNAPSIWLGHQNDATSFMMIYKKNAPSDPAFEMLITSDHNEVNQYTPDQLAMDHGSPIIEVTNGTHQLSPRLKADEEKVTDRVVMDVLVSDENPNKTTGDVQYDLVSGDELWAQRFNVQVFKNATETESGSQFFGTRAGWAPWARKFSERANAYLDPINAFAGLYEGKVYSTTYVTEKKSPDAASAYIRKLLSYPRICFINPEVEVQSFK